MENSKRNVFVIEDNKTEGMLLKLCLGSIKNLKIYNFASAKDLFDNLHENPSIIIADLMLPDITGYKLIETLKEKVPEVPIIVISAQKDINLIGKIQELGIYNYVVKGEACIEYLQKIVEDLLLIIEKKEELEKYE